jgi:hypothetical protein
MAEIGIRAIAFILRCTRASNVGYEPALIVAAERYRPDRRRARADQILREPSQIDENWQ